MIFITKRYTMKIVKMVKRDFLSSVCYFELTTENFALLKLSHGMKNL